VGPWNNSRNKFLFPSTTGKSKHSVSAIISLDYSISINCLIASKAISSLLKFSIVSKILEAMAISFLENTILYQVLILVLALLERKLLSVMV
jgi:hypothetical protein